MPSHENHLPANAVNGGQTTLTQDVNTLLVAANGKRTFLRIRADAANSGNIHILRASGEAVTDAIDKLKSGNTFILQGLGIYQGDIYVRADAASQIIYYMESEHF